MGRFLAQALLARAPQALFASGAELDSGSHASLPVDASFVCSILRLGKLSLRPSSPTDECPAIRQKKTSLHPLGFRGVSR